MPALEIIVGKSVRQLRRILNPPSEPTPKTRTHDLVSQMERFLECSERLSEQLGSDSAVPELVSLKAELGRANRLTGRALVALRAPAAP
jgi:hypothetical protein